MEFTESQIKIIRRKHAKHVEGAKYNKNVGHLTFEQYIGKIYEAGIMPEQIGRHIGDYCLGRKTDSGNYTPDTCNFITVKQNQIDRVSNGGSRRNHEKPIAASVEVTKKRFRFVSPDGVIFEGENIREFCRQNKLFNSNMTRVSKGLQTHHKGWTI